MRVYQVNICGDLSTGKIAVDLHRMLIEGGHEGRIGYARNTIPEDINSYRIGSRTEIMHHAIMSRVTDKAGFYSKTGTKDLIEDIEKFNPHILHLHNIHGYYVNIQLLFNYIKEKKIKTIWTLHDCWAFTGHCAYFDGLDCKKWITGCYQCEGKKEYPKSSVMDRSAKNWKEKKEIFTNADLTLVTPSNWLKNLVEESFLQGYKVKTIYNGIDLKVFSPRPSDFREKYCLQQKYIILGVASIWDARKGLYDFIKLHQLIDRNQVQIVLIGLNKKQKAELPEGMIGMERTKTLEELIEIYTAADLFFNPSIGESFGLTTVEALACGTQVAVYNVTALPEIVSSMGGTVLEKGDLEGVLSILEKPSWKPEDCREAARKYDNEVARKQYMELYEEKRKFMDSILYFTIMRESAETYGINMKIRNQVKAFARLGLDSYFCVSTDTTVKLYYCKNQEFQLIEEQEFSQGAIFCPNKNTIGRKLSSNRRLKECLDFMVEQVEAYGISHVYIRRIFPIGLKLVRVMGGLADKGIKVAWEIPTWREKIYDGNIVSSLLYMEEVLVRKYFYKKKITVAAIYSKEIKEKGVVFINNGVDIDTIKPKVQAPHQGINLMCLATFAYWHGYDRIIKGLKNYYANTENPKEVSLYMVGNGEVKELEELAVSEGIENHVKFVGLQVGEALDDLIDQMDVAVGNIGFFRLEIFSDASIKIREYAARGIPFVTALAINDFPQDASYICRVPMDESDIVIEDIVSFYEALDYPQVSGEMRAFAVERLTWEEQLRKVLEEMNHVTSTSI